MSNVQELDTAAVIQLIENLHAKKSRENITRLQDSKHYADKDAAFWKRVEEEYSFGEFLYDSDSKGYYVDLEGSRYAVSLAESKLGSEGGGEDIWVVFTIADADKNERHFQFSGFYSSWDGSDWGDWKYSLTEVAPEEKTVIVWNKKK